jgi:hypothetical protein
VAVITTDILISGMRRDDVFAWLSDPDNHELILQDAFANCRRGTTKEWTIDVAIPGRPRVMGYHFIEADERHGGRRVLIKTSGKRLAGKMHYSLRTIKPSKNTMVTLRLDYSPGGALGSLLNAAGLKTALETGMGKMLENLARAAPTG